MLKSNFDLMCSLGTALGSLLLPALASANVGINGGPCVFATIGAAAAAAAAGDRLYVSPGVYQEGTINLISKDLSIYSSDANCNAVTSRQAIFEPTPGQRGFFVEDSLLILLGMEVRLANTALAGATAFLQLDSGITLVDTIFKQSTSGNSGGCIYAAQSTVTLGNEAELDRCTATSDGGGIFLDIQSTLYSLANSSVHDSVALNGNGGGVYVGGATAHVWGDISENEGTWGGGLCVSVKNGLSASATLKGEATLNGNSADYGGGAYVALSTLSIRDDADVKNNHANVNGGGLFADGATLDMAGASLGAIAIDGNTADHRGAGAYLGASDLTASFVKFSDNVASGNGGGLYASFGELDFTNARINDNEGAYGGGMLLDDATLTMRSDFETCDPSTLVKDRFCSEFRSNLARNAQGEGGALRVVGGSDATVETTSFMLNEATISGGAVSAKDTGTQVDLRNTLVVDNQVNSGDAVAMRDGVLNVWSSTFADNFTPVAYLAGATGEFHRNIVWDNVNDAVTAGISGNCNTTQTLAGAPAGSANNQLDPKFAPGNSRSAHKLKNNSPAIDACGTGPNIDLDAVTRAQRLSFDKGAFEMP